MNYTHMVVFRFSDGVEGNVPVVFENGITIESWKRAENEIGKFNGRPAVITNIVKLDG